MDPPEIFLDNREGEETLFGLPQCRLDWKTRRQQANFALPPESYVMPDDTWVDHWDQFTGHPYFLCGMAFDYKVLNRVIRQAADEYGGSQEFLEKVESLQGVVNWIGYAYDNLRHRYMRAAALAETGMETEEDQESEVQNSKVFNRFMRVFRAMLAVFHRMLKICEVKMREQAERTEKADRKVFLEALMFDSRYHLNILIRVLHRFGELRLDKEGADYFREQWDMIGLPNRYFSPDFPATFNTFNITDVTDTIREEYEDVPEDVDISNEIIARLRGRGEFGLEPESSSSSDGYFYLSRDRRQVRRSDRHPA
jgi:hypothetical protein